MKTKTRFLILASLVAFLVGCLVTINSFTSYKTEKNILKLIEKTGPLRICAVNLQKQFQSCIVSFVKTCNSENSKSLSESVSESQKNLENLKKAEDGFSEISKTAIGASSKLEVSYDELKKKVSDKIVSKDKVDTSTANVSKKLSSVTAALKQMDSKIQKLQAGRGSAFSGAMVQTNGFSARLRAVEDFRTILSSVENIYLKILLAPSKKSVTIMKSKINTLTPKLQGNDFVKGSKEFSGDSKKLIDKIEELAKLQTAYLGDKTQDRSRIEAIGVEVSEMVNALNMSVDQEITLLSDRYKVETKNQEKYYSQSSKSNTVLVKTSLLVSQGLSIESLTTRLANANSLQEAENHTREIQDRFSRLQGVYVELKKELGLLNAKEEIQLLDSAFGMLTSIRSDIFTEKGGMLSEIRNYLNTQEQAKQMMIKVREDINTLTEDIDEVVVRSTAEQEGAVTEIKGSIYWAVRLNIIIGIFVICVILLVTRSIYIRSIYNLLNALNDDTKKLADGNLDISFSFSRCEFGDVQRSLSSVIDNLRGFVGNIRGAISVLGDGVGSLSRSQKLLSENYDHTSLKVAQVSSSVEEMSQTIQDVDANTKVTASLAIKMSEGATSGKRAMDETSDELSAFMSDTIRDIQMIRGLEQHSQEISGITDEIRYIADQINLLSLNASIEAAHAGVHGEGFSVVANEVKRLAAQTIESATSIGEKIRSISNEVNLCVISMEQRGASVGLISEKVDNTLTVIEDIKANAAVVADRIGEISVIVSQQSQASDDIASSMLEIQQMTDKLGGAVSEIKKVGGGLEEESQKLTSIISFFKTNASG